VVDLLDLYSRVSPEQLLYASDFPYGGQPAQLLLDLRIAELAGYSREELEGILGRNASRIADREDPPPLSPPKLGSRAFRQPIAMARIHTYLTMATPLLWTRQPDTIGALGLALNAAAEQDGQAEVREQIIDLLSCARDLWVSASELEETDRMQQMRLAFRLVHLADIESLTAQP
jgi:ParB-like chromosome segregation protein Spo0J